MIIFTIYNFQLNGSLSWPGRASREGTWAIAFSLIVLVASRRNVDVDDDDLYICYRTLRVDRRCIYGAVWLGRIW